MQQSSVYLLNYIALYPIISRSDTLHKLIIVKQYHFLFYTNKKTMMVIGKVARQTLELGTYIVY
jgi:hypothetical protein